jgi:transcriptional regulator with XRE-family HTH domain
MTLHQYTKRLRENAGLSQKEVAAKLGYKSGQVVSNYERGLCRPPLASLPQLARLYGVSLRTLFNRYAEDVKRGDWEVVKGGE